MRRFKFLYNKYLLATLMFLAVMLFLDQNNWFVQQDRANELKSLNESIEFINKEIDNMNQSLKEVKTNPKIAEQYARENYILKKPNEDVYLIIHDTIVQVNKK